jgi:hypothetical protein
MHLNFSDRLCGLLFRVPGWISRDPGFDSRRCHIFWEVVDLEWVPLRIVNITEELLEWKSSGSGSRKPRLTAVGIRCTDDATSSIRKFGINFADKRRSLADYSHGVYVNVSIVLVLRLWLQVWTSLIPSPLRAVMVLTVYILHGNSHRFYT